MAKQIVVKSTGPFERDLAVLPLTIQKRVEKALLLFTTNPHHPSLRAKKMRGFENIWEGRVSGDYRFTFSIVSGVYYLRRVGAHDIEKNP